MKTSAWKFSFRRGGVAGQPYYLLAVKFIIGYFVLFVLSLVSCVLRWRVERWRETVNWETPARLISETAVCCGELASSTDWVALHAVDWLGTTPSHYKAQSRPSYSRGLLAYQQQGFTPPVLSPQTFRQWSPQNFSSLLWVLPVDFVFNLISLFFK